MTVYSDKLNLLIDQFLCGKISAETFEKEFSEIYDFEDSKDDISEIFFKQVREVLEHFSPYTEDKKKHSDFFIDDNELKSKVEELKRTLKV